MVLENRGRNPAQALWGGDAMNLSLRGKEHPALILRIGELMVEANSFVYDDFKLWSVGRGFLPMRGSAENSVIPIDTG